MWCTLASDRLILQHVNSSVLRRIVKAWSGTLGRQRRSRFTAPIRDIFVSRRRVLRADGASASIADRAPQRPPFCCRPTLSATCRLNTMPRLGRNASKLLKTVNNKPHATQADHHDVLPTPPATNSTRSSGSQGKLMPDEEDIMRDPVSSEDERASPPPIFVPASTTDGAQDELPPRPKFRQRTDTRGAELEKETSVEFKQPTRPQIRSPESSTRSKRSSGSDEQEQGSSDADDTFFSSQSSMKRQKTGNTNIHAPPRRDKVQYGKKAQRKESSSRKDFKKPTNSAEEAKEPEKPTFQPVKIDTDLFRFQGEQAQFKRPDDPGARRTSLSPSLSSLSSVPASPEVEEVATFHLPAPTPYCATATCDLCGLAVDKLLKEDFEDRYTRGRRPMPFKWQQRFCAHHRRDAARREWRERGYPDIEWAALGRRMRRFDGRLRDVLCDRVESAWKRELKRQLRPDRARGGDGDEEGEGEDVTPRAWTGYYGPRGEKAMTEHIVAHLSDDLRERASKDKMVAAKGVKGVKGGVSGFVHSVLVPELACLLVAEDLGLAADQARTVVEKSVDIGVLLNPEVEEEVVRDGRGKEEGDEMEL